MHAQNHKQPMVVCYHKPQFTIHVFLPYYTLNSQELRRGQSFIMYEGWNFNSGNYLFTTDTK